MEQFPGRIITVRKFLNEEVSVDWLVDGLLANVGWTLLIGRKGVGKTTFAIQLASAMQAGDLFMGRETKRSKVLFCQFDSFPIEWKAILTRLAPEEKWFTMVNCPSYSLDNEAYVSSICNLIGQVQPNFVIWDSLYKLSRRNINTTQVQETIETLLLICPEIPFMVIHHPPHTELRASGHNSIGGTCSNEWHLLKNKLVIDKSRLSGEKEILLSRDDNGLWLLKEDEQEVSGVLTMPII